MNQNQVTMKKLVLHLCLLACMAMLSIPMTAQISTPAPSPASKLTQTVGLTDITVEYSRPAVKGRTIFADDGLVPYGKVWRTGANAATKITFSDAVKVGGEELEAGSYAILTKPMKDKWEVMFYPYEGGNWSSYTEKDPAAKVEAKTVDMGQITVENFTIDINENQGDKAMMWMMWNKTAAGVPLQVEVDKKVMASIDRVLNGPSANDYFAAASYYHETGKDLEKALKWIKMANDTDEPRFWQVRREALILADMGKKDEAIKAAKKSLELAEKAGNEDYIRMNTKSIKEWSDK